MGSTSMRRGVYGLMAACCLTLIVVLLLLPSLWQRADAQAPTLTPLPVLIVTRTETPPPFESPTPSRTPTPEVSTIRAEAREEANIRSAPSLDSQVLFKEKPGRFFAVTGRYGMWLQIRYDRAASGVAWVYEDVVVLTGGDPATIPIIDPQALPTANVATAGAQQTSEFLTATPGAPETATVMQASATGIFTRAADGGVGTPLGPQPTFTYPPAFVEATLPARVSLSARGTIPPIVFIAGLGMIGVAGMLIGMLRRR